MPNNILQLTSFVLMLFRPYAVNASLKIVNGVEVEPHSLPYMAALESIIEDRTIRCGGSLIKTNKILTALKLIVYMANFTIHNDYDDDTHLNNIAIIYLEEKVTLTDSIQTISTPIFADLLVSYNDDTGLVSGWGKYNETVADYSKVLLKIDVTIIPYLACTISYLGKIKSSQMCTSGMQNGQNICMGDAGSPLVVNETQVGIASYGSDFGCAVGAPGVYTRLTSYYFWLIGV